MYNLDNKTELNQANQQFLIRRHNRRCKKNKKEKSGDVLISQEAPLQVSSALKSLTTVFEMGTGVSSLLLSPHFLLRAFGLLLRCCSLARQSLTSVSSFLALSRASLQLRIRS